MKRRLRFGACMLAAAMLAGSCAVPAGAVGYAVPDEERQWTTSGFCGSNTGLGEGWGEDAYGKGISWELDDSGTVTITGTGSMYSFYYEARGSEGGATMKSPWAFNPAIKKAVIGEGVTTIGTCAFSGCENLAEIVVPDSVVNIESDAFWKTAWYRNQPDGMVYAGKVAYAYKGVPSDNTIVEIKEGTVSICGTAFDGDDYDYLRDTFMSQIQSFILPDSLLNLNVPIITGTEGYNEQAEGSLYVNHVAYAFKGELPEEIEIQDGTIGINSNFIWPYPPEGTATEISNLKSVVIPASVKYIGSDAFAYCENLTSVTIKNPNCIINDAAPAFYQALDMDIDYGTITYTFNGTIYGYAGSTAEAYAKKHNVNFQVIEAATDVQGDFNGDGEVSIEDVQLTLKLYTESVAAGKELATDQQIAAADINKDGKIKVEDVQLILKYYVCNKVAKKHVTWEELLQETAQSQ